MELKRPLNCQNAPCFAAGLVADNGRHVGDVCHQHPGNIDIHAKAVYQAKVFSTEPVA